jgi:hypothetical protein
MHGRTVLKYILRIEWEDLDCIMLAKARGQWWSVEHSNEPLGCIKCREFLD